MNQKIKKPKKRNQTDFKINLISPRSSVDKSQRLLSVWSGVRFSSWAPKKVKIDNYDSTKTPKNEGYLLVVPNLFIATNKNKIKIKDTEYSVRGVLAKIILSIPTEISPKTFIDSGRQIQIRGLERIKLSAVEKKQGILRGNYEVLPEKKLSEEQQSQLVEKLLRYLPVILEKVRIPVGKLPTMSIKKNEIGLFLDSVAQHGSEIDNLIKWGILVSTSVEERLDLLVNFLDKKVKTKIRNQLKNQYEKHYLQEKLHAIKKKIAELENAEGSEKDGAKNDPQSYLEQLETGIYPEKVKSVVREEIARKRSSERSDLDFARRKLDENHYGLTDIKERIIEYLAVRKKMKESSDEQEEKKSVVQILCLVGPPGVGKTSLARSIAEALGLKFAHISVAGMRDVAEIKGHRRTYIGAMPGRIIQSVKKVGAENFVFLIDEIDKVSYDHRADPIDALLEVLDPNQNYEFTDDYLGNDKFHIAKEYLIPENLEKYDLTSSEIEFRDEAIKEIIKNYVQETGVRELNRKIQTIIRKFILQIVEKKVKRVIITSENLSSYLKKKNHEPTAKPKQARKGVVVGELTLTGNLGDIMKESAQVALAYIKSNCHKFQIKPEFFSQNDINVHVLEGATPKEGPSAGIALTSAIISDITGQVVSRDLVIAAHRSKIKTVIIPKANEKDIDDIPAEVRKEVKIVLAADYEE
ncbi:18360_t:CDS:2, partial [Gigaspora margarita]